jgi:hypothetical protein
MLKSLRSRLERLEAARGKGAPEFTIVRRIIPDGWAIVTEIRNGIVSRREVTAEEAERLREGATTIDRTYGSPTSEARDDLPPTEKI